MVRLSRWRIPGSLDVERLADDYLESRWEEIVDDIFALVSIPSVEDLGASALGEPYGPHVARAIGVTLDIARRLGFTSSDMDGYMGIADLDGTGDAQVAIIGHVDVVDAGPGWNFDPFLVTRREGYLIGRGTADDKGPLVVAMHAAALWGSLGIELPHAIRILVGGNEETGMADVPEYLGRYDPPDFLFTPDADFPVCYGEKGTVHLMVESRALVGGAIRSMEGGVAVNAVPGSASATILCEDPGSLSASDGIVLSREADGLVRIEALGRSAHASTPTPGVNAIGILASYLAGCGSCSADEVAFLELLSEACFSTDGSSMGIACSDDDFGDLTLACGMVRMKDGKISFTLDARYPTSITAEEIERLCDEAVRPMGGGARLTLCKPPFLIDPGSDCIKVLVDAYNDVTGEDAKPFTAGAATYARLFPRAASFGPAMPQRPVPEWVGVIHGADEGISEDLLKLAFRIYVRAIGGLMEVEF